MLGECPKPWQQGCPPFCTDFSAFAVTDAYVQHKAEDVSVCWRGPSHCSTFAVGWLVEVLLYVHSNRRFIKSTNKIKNPSKASEVPSDIVIHSHFYFFLIHRRALCSQPVRGNVCRIGRMFPEYVQRSFLDPEYSFVAVRRILRTIFAKQKFAQLRTNYIRRILLTMFANKCSPN